MYGELYHNYQDEVPDDGAVILELYQDLKTANVPFALADVSMPGHAPADAKPDAANKAAGGGQPRPKPAGTAPDNF